MVIKKTQPNLFVLGRKISDVTPKASSTLENFLAFLTIDFPPLLNALENGFKFRINVQQNRKKKFNWIASFS